MMLFAVLIIGLFLPLFPLSIVFNQALQHLDSVRHKAILIIVWPQIGLLLLYLMDSDSLHWVLPWAALTALLYAFRMVTQRNMTAWVGFLATSAFSLLWITAVAGEALPVTSYALLGFSIPLVMLLFLAHSLEQRFGAAYTGLYGGLATSIPRFSATLIYVTLAAVATPIFPAFFVMLKSLTLSTPLIAILLVTTWLIWSWASALLFQGLLIGEPDEELPQDISLTQAWAYAVAVTMLVMLGLMLTGGLA